MNGVNKVVHHLATEQNRMGCDVEVWGISKNLSEIRHQHIYPLYLFPTKLSRFFISKQLSKKIVSLRSEKAIFHLHSVFIPELFGICRILKREKLTWVLSPHSGYAPQSMKKNWLIKYIYMLLFEKHVITGAARVHAIGDSEVDDLIKLGKKLDIVLIPNGQSFEEVKFIPTTCLEAHERPVFGYCGRLAKNHKGLDLLIQGFAQFKQNHGKGELWLIGEGPDEDFLKTLSEKEGVINSVKFLGKMFGDVKLSHIFQMDIFIHTSRWEGMPMAVLEAAALGKPVLVSKATNLGKYISQYNNGKVLRENSTYEIKNALFSFEDIYFKSGLNFIGAKSKHLVKNNLTWPIISKKMLTKLYRQ